jgi:Fe-S-cluster containining protein
MPPQPVAFDVALDTATGPLRGRVAIDPGPMRLAELVPQALELTDLLASRAVRKEAGEGRVVSCAKGCGACCRQPAPLSIPEVFWVAALVGRLREPTRARALAAFRDAEERLERAGQRAVWLAEPYDEDAALAAMLPYFQLGIACPFLVDEACAVHPVRPTRCREFAVTTPAAWCAEPTANLMRTVPVAPMSAPLARLASELTGEPHGLVPLTLALRWADENRALGERTWPGPELFSAFLRHLAGGSVPEQIEPPG